MSISPISSSMMSMYVPSSGTQKVDNEYQLIMKELVALGIAPSGDKDADKTRLDIAKRVKKMQESQNSSESKQSIPFDDVMNNLNLTVTGNLDKDYNTTIDKLDYEIGMASSEDEQGYYQALKDQVENEYNSSKKNSISYFSGASQVSSMNRYMLGI